MSRDEMLRRARLRRALADYSRRRVNIPDWLDTCVGCGGAIDEPLARAGRGAWLCRACALRLDDARPGRRALR